MSESQPKDLPDSQIQNTARILKNLMALIDAHEFKGFKDAVAVKEMGEFVSELYKEIEGRLPKPEVPQPFPVAAPDAPVSVEKPLAESAMGEAPSQPQTASQPAAQVN